MKTAGDLVALSAELAAGMKSGHDGLESRDPGLLMDVYRNTAAVVYYPHAVAGQECYLDVVGEAAHSFVA